MQKKKSKQNQMKIKTKSNRDKIKNKKEKENNITLSSNEDNGASTVYWNEEINECLEIIKSFNGWLIDGTQKWNRIYWKNLIWKLKESPPVKIKWYSRQNTLKAILQVVSQNKYHRTKITNPKTIYDNLTLLFQVCDEEWKKQTVMQAL